MPGCVHSLVAALSPRARRRHREHMVDLSSLGAATMGVWTRRQALQLLGRGAVEGLLHRKVWQVVWPGVYADAGFALSAEQRCWAALLASGGEGQPVPFGPPHPRSGRRRRRLRAVVCGRMAARYWQLPLIDDADPATGAHEHLLDDVSVWRHLPDLERDGRTLHRHQLHLPLDDMVRTQSGLWITTPLRTLVDCVGLLSREAAVCALDGALRAGVVTATDLTAAVARLSGTPGCRRVASAVSVADGRAEAPSETLTRLLLLPVLPSLEPQVELFDRHGRVVARFDLGDRKRRLAVESDGKAAHSGPAMVAKDRRRDDRIEPYGWWTERVTWYEVRRQQTQTVRRILRRVERLGPIGPPALLPPSPRAVDHSPGDSLRETPARRRPG